MKKKNPNHSLKKAYIFIYVAWIEKSLDTSDPSLDKSGRLFRLSCATFCSNDLFIVGRQTFKDFGLKDSDLMPRLLWPIKQNNPG